MDNDHVPSDFEDQTDPESSWRETRGRSLSHLTWYGILPIAVVCAPAILRWCFPGKHDITDVIAVVLVPIAASLIRASIGWKKLCELFAGRAPIGRQFVLAFAIIVLMIFEFYAAATYCSAGPVPQHVYLQMLLMYFVYLVLITFALRRPRAQE